jgi:superinfection exclusion protein B
LNDWIKFYEAITKPLPVASSLFLFVATSFLLLASGPTLAKLGLSLATTDYRWVVGSGFIVAATWLVVTGLIWSVKQCHQTWSEHKAKQKQHQRLHALTADERRLLSGYVTKEVRSCIFHAAPDLAAAQGLADDGVLYRPNALPNEPVAVPYNIQEWALAYLNKNKTLVAAVVPAPTRWK